VRKLKMASRRFIWVKHIYDSFESCQHVIILSYIAAAQGDHVDAARILLYYKSTLVDDVSSVSQHQLGLH
jgi:hypothetical protein